MFLPGLLLGLISCWHRGILKTFISHPSILLLPVFTHFTFTSSTKWCKRNSKEEGEEEDEEEEEKTGGGEAEEPFIVFSPKFTLLNLLLNLLAQVAYGLSMTHIVGWDKFNTDFGTPSYLTFYLLLGVPSIILGLLFTPLSLALTSTRQTCCSRFNCCYTCFTLSRVEFGVLLPSKPNAPFVLDANGKPKPEDEEVKIEETELVDNEEAKNIEKQSDEMVELVDNQAEDNLDIDMV